MQLTNAVAGEVQASLVVALRCTWKDLDGKVHERFKHTEIPMQVENLVTGAYPIAAVTKTSHSKVSHSEYWGAGDWDKIPYCFEALTSITLNCDQTEISLITASNMAEDITMASGKDHLARLLVSHSTEIRTRLFKHLFEEDDV